MVRIELYANGIDEISLVKNKMERIRQLTSTDNGYVYSAQVSSTRPASDFTARVVPFYDGVAVPLETAQILWQR
jgi:starch phosphorylase